MTALRIAVCGSTGRMGHALLHAMEQDASFAYAGGIANEGDDTPHNTVTPDACAPLLQNADVLIDFSSPEALGAVLTGSESNLDGKALVIGTTGLTAEVLTAIERVARNTAVVTVANFSVGVNLLLDLVRKAASVLDDAYDVEIVEAHHRNKLDSPSGTALAFARAVAEGRDVSLDDIRRDGRSGMTGKRPAGEIGMHALRGGAVIGEHSVHFIGDAERIEIAHIASDRALFANGALRAARWASGQKPGMYTMHDVLGL